MRYITVNDKNVPYYKACRVGKRTYIHNGWHSDAVARAIRRLNIDYKTMDVYLASGEAVTGFVAAKKFYTEYDFYRLERKWVWK